MVTPEIRYFLRKALLFCLVLIGISLILFESLLKDYYLRVFPLQFTLVSLVTVFSHLRLMSAVHQNVRRFNTKFLSIMAVKLFVYLCFILVCLLIDRSQAVNFVLTFLILYMSFTIFEVYQISNFLKKDTKSSI
jgi:hypothetical protein